MADEQELQIDLELDPAGEAIVAEPKVEQVEVAPKENAEDPISALQKQYNELKAQDASKDAALEVSRRAEADARAQADRANRVAAEAQTQIANTSFQSVEHEIAARDSEIQVAKRDYASAMESADYAKAAEAQDKLAQANATKALLARDKATLDTQRKQQTVVLDQRQPDPLGHLSHQSRAWLQAHPECLQDQEKYLLMSAAHTAAVKTQLTPDTPEYFNFIERRLGYADEPQSQPRSRSMPAAPPSRDSAPGASKVSVQLSANEVKSATDGTIVWNVGPNKGKPVGTQEMARRKALLQKDGKYSNISIN